ncbi:degenerin-like protein [Trichonephila clavipes]|nr:degenerin-like protein [Trichonephila clavipes]
MEFFWGQMKGFLVYGTPFPPDKDLITRISVAARTMRDTPEIFQNSRNSMQEDRDDSESHRNSGTQMSQLRAMVQRNAEREQKQQHINGTENILLNSSTATGNGSQMTTSRRIGVLEIFRSAPSTARLHGGIFQNNIETFSYVGGYVGMWLGISLVAVFDFLETLVIMMRYPFRRVMMHKAKKEQIDKVRKIQRDM